MPLFGAFVDRKGKRMTIIFFGGLVTFGMHVVLLLLPDCHNCIVSMIPWIMYGFSLAIYMTVMWGSLSYVVPEHLLGIAYGVLVCIQNIGCTFLPYLMGTIHDHSLENDHGYFWVEIAFIFFSGLSLILKYWLYSWDQRVRQGILQSSNPAVLSKKYFAEKYNY